MSVTLRKSTNDLIVDHYTDKSIMQVEKITIPATEDADQGDYIIIENQTGTKFAVWLDIDADGTAPSGALYGASDNQTEVNIATGDTNIENAAAFVAAINADVSVTGVVLVDNLDGTVTVTREAGTCDANVVKNSDDSGAGSITSSIVVTGVSPILKYSVFLPFKSFVTVIDRRDGILFLNSNATSSVEKGGGSIEIVYSEVTSPVTANIEALALLINGDSIVSW